MSEVTPLPSGYTLTSPSGPVTGTVTVPQETPDRAAFVNTYAPAATPAVATPTIQKVLDGENWQAGDVFQALLRPQFGGDDVVRPLGTDPSAAAFGEIAFTAPGTYVYTITEVDGNEPGVSYSGAEYTWTVTVTDNGTGTLTATDTLTKVRNDAGVTVSEPAATAVFTNLYSLDSETGNLQATKMVEDRTQPGDPHRAPTLEHDFFYWYLASSSADAPAAPRFPGDLTQVTVSTSGSSVVSPDLTFGQEHVGYTYYYAVKELPNAAHQGVIYDTSAYIYRLEVLGASSDAEDAPQVQVVSSRCKTEASAIVNGQVPQGCTFSENTETLFLNVYEAAPGTAELGGTKTLSGRPWADGDAFTFDLMANNAATDAAIDAGIVIMPYAKSLEVVAADQTGGTAAFLFDAVTFTKQGEYQFRVVERASGLPDVVDDLHPAVYDVVVTDPDVDGDLDVAVTVRGGDAATTFTNRWVSASTYSGVDLVKVLPERDLRWNEFSFTVTANDPESAARLNVPAEGVTVTNGENHGDVSLATVLGPVTFTQADLDRTFTYTVVENNTGLGGVTYDPAVHTVTITPVYDAEDGVLDVITTVDGEVQYSTLAGDTPSSRSPTTTPPRRRP